MVGTEESMPDVMYQVDSRNTATGKIVASSKQRACWRYGHMKNDPHPIGASCRGREHEVTVIWSITSGKRFVYHDSKEVHFSVVPMGRRGNSKFQCSWSSRDHIFTVIAYANSKPNRKQFELLINGFSFNNLPKIYELPDVQSSLSMRSSTRSVSMSRSKSTGTSQTCGNEGSLEDLEWFVSDETREVTSSRRTRDVTSSLRI